MQPILPTTSNANGNNNSNSTNNGLDGKKRGRGAISYKEDAGADLSDELNSDEEAEREAERKRKKKGKDASRSQKKIEVDKDEGGKASWLGEIPPGDKIVIKVAGRTKHVYP